MYNAVIEHYGNSRDLIALISERLRQAGRDPGSLTSRDLASIDEFHVRGRQATMELITAMKIKRHDRVLDIGSGLGGPARAIVECKNCHVTGLDLSPELTEVAITLSSWLGMTSSLSFQTGDATAMPFQDNQFDVAVSLHTAMNIADKPRFYAEVMRTLKPRSLFGIYDVLQGEGGEAVYPLPWARTSSISHLITIRELTSLMEAAGFTIQVLCDSTAESAAWLTMLLDRRRRIGPPPLAFELLFGDLFPVMMDNLAQNLAERRLRTVTCIARCP